MYGASSQRELTDRDFDDITNELVKQSLQLKKLPTKKLRMSLTGGKVSRVNLVFSLNTGLVEKIDSIFSSGREGSPEIEIAAYICKELGLDHTAQSSNPAQFDLNKTWGKLKYHAFRFEGSISLGMVSVIQQLVVVLKSTVWVEKYTLNLLKLILKLKLMDFSKHIVFLKIINRRRTL
ncbi:hypothetical protein BKP37_14785 [Anaerobacillus alkalilacustris]|uniref:Uncharacterized protein n=1 Tax=Anaerobacillus alkalilacustris TaxID=393763 RepID=A0A1S2LGS6_9BACI|nr:hypothetical protein [Anaerobacillus alkalilacustris]OIJ11708.1 hypothetical protein BKP37_14785 [Anaerobacillus alkalilacustris]